MDLAPQFAGTAGGMMNLGFGIAGILSPFLFGFLIDRTGSWQVPFTTSVLLLFVGVLLALRIDPTRPLELPSRGS
jgi:MFS family permease